jgi:hypothetical protein
MDLLDVDPFEFVDDEPVRHVERWNPLQPRAADGTWGVGAGRFHGDAGTIHIDRTEDGGVDLGIGPAGLDAGEDEDEDGGATARLSAAGVRQLHERLTAAAAAGRRRQATVDAHWEQHGTGPADAEDYVIASGFVPGDGADVHYSVELYDPDIGVQTFLGAIPHTSDETLDDLVGSDRAALFEPAEVRKLLGRLATVAGTTESVALDLWRALEARHNLRGPDGRFVSAGGSSRPSLADVVRGTAAGGPKRRRADEGGMSVADAVRAAARQSDSTGRPTQRTPAEHRAEGAHAVADEVDRALAEAGVPDDIRQQVAARARAVADGNGPRKRERAKPAAKRAPARMDADRLAGIAGQLDAAASRDEARQHLAGLTAAQLRQLADAAQVAVGAGDTKARLQDRLVDSIVGRRLDAAAIDRMTRR